MTRYTGSFFNHLAQVYDYLVDYEQLMKLSVIIPLFNEEDVLKKDMEPFVLWLHKIYATIEVVLVENGSADKTLPLARTLARKYSYVRVISLKKPSFGAAVKTGILEASGTNGILLNADWLDRDFILSATPLLDECDIVIGSKTLDGGLDSRPLYRKMASYCLTFVLKWFYQFEFSDSHGLKAFRLKAAKRVMQDCTLNEIIESEFLLSAQTSGLVIKEIAVPIRESRPPRVSFVKRIFAMASELTQLSKVRKRLKYAKAR